MKKLLYLILFFPFIAFGQHAHRGATQSSHSHDMSKIPMIRWKFYGGIGTSVYGGELTGRKIISSNSMFNAIQSKTALTLGIGYKINNRVLLRAELTNYTIKAMESDATMEKFGRKENYQMKATNYELAVLSQINLLPYNYFLDRRINIVPYLVVGFGATTSTTQGWNNGEWEKLSSLSGNQVKNKILGVVPFGAGFSYRLNNQLDIGLEGTVHYTLGGSLDGDTKNGISTDLLSEEGKTYYDKYYNEDRKIIMKENPRFHDLYAIVQVRLQYTIIPEKFRTLFNQKEINFTHRPHGPLRLR
jgi:hypothetical protein